VDFLRTTYKSKFFYGRNPDENLVGRYCYAAEDAEVLLQSSFYRSGIWLDPWELIDGLGDSLEDYERVEGIPLSDDIVNTNRIVLPLQSGCPSLGDTTMTMSEEIQSGVPTKCWKKDAIRRGHWSYRVNIVGFSANDGTTTYSYSGESLLLWDGGSSTWFPVSGPSVPFLESVGEYPEGSGFELSAFNPFGNVPSEIFTAVLSLGQQRSFTTLTAPWVLPIGWSLVDAGEVIVTYERVGDDDPVNPADEYPM